MFSRLTKSLGFLAIVLAATLAVPQFTVAQSDRDDDDPPSRAARLSYTGGAVSFGMCSDTCEVLPPPPLPEPEPPSASTVPALRHNIPHNHHLFIESLPRLSDLQVQVVQGL